MNKRDFTHVSTSSQDYGDESPQKRQKLEESSHVNLTTIEDHLVLTDEQVQELMAERDVILEHAGIILQDLVDMPRRIDVSADINKLFDAYKQYNLDDFYIKDAIGSGALDSERLRHTVSVKDIEFNQSLANAVDAQEEIEDFTGYACAVDPLLLENRHPSYEHEELIQQFIKEPVKFGWKADDSYDSDDYSDEKSEINDPEVLYQSDEDNDYCYGSFAVIQHYTFDTDLNRNFADENIDRIIRQKAYFCQWDNTQYDSVFTRIVSILVEHSLPPQDYDSTDYKGADKQYMSEAMMANYLRVLKIMIRELEKKRAELREECPRFPTREFGMWCRVLPRAVINEFAVFDEKFVKDITKAKYEVEDFEEYLENEEDGLVDDSWSETDSESEAENNDQEEDLQSESYSDDEEMDEETEIEDLRISTNEEIENSTCLMSREIADRWLHVDTEEEGIVEPLIDQQWFDEYDTSDDYMKSYILGDYSGIETIEEKMQPDEPVDDELPPSLHLDIMRLMRAGAVGFQTPHAIAEGFFTLRGYIHEVIKQVLLNKTDHGEITVEDIEEAVFRVEGLKPTRLYSTCAVTDEKESEEGKEEDSDYESDYTRPVELRPFDPKMPFLGHDDVNWNPKIKTNTEEEKDDNDEVIETTVIPVPASTFYEDITSSSCLRIVESVPNTDASELVIKTCSQYVIALKSIMAVRCPGTIPHFSTGIDLTASEETKGMDAARLYDYLCTLYTGVLNDTTADASITLFGQDIPTNEQVENEEEELVLQELIHDHRYADFTIKVGEESFRVHKHILISRCDYFSTMFSSGLSESKTNELDMSDAIPTAELAKLVIECLYTDEVESMTVQQALELLPVTKFLILQRLGGLCELLLARSIDEENVETILRVATHFESQQLFDVGASFISRRLYLCETSEFTPDEQQYFEWIGSPIDTFNVIELLTWILSQLKESKLDKLYLNHLEQKVKPHCINYIVRNRHCVNEEALGTLIDVRTGEQEGEPKSILQIVENMTRSWNPTCDEIVYQEVSCSNLTLE
jgi:hypothetical protein